MMHPGVDERVLGYLGRALSMELSAVQLYTTQARLVTSWGLDEPAKKFRHEAHEEMGHVERIISRMLALGVAPNASQLRPVKLGRDLSDLLEYDRAFEDELVSLYTDAATHCAHSGDHEGRLFFAELLEEEKQHSRELVHWLAELEQPGVDPSIRGASF
jgi:bacterioferritin